MLMYTLAGILVIAWIVVVNGAATHGAFVHLLLVVAIALFLVAFLPGRRPPA